MTKYNKDLLSDPYSLFNERTANIRLRILNLQEDYSRVDHYISKAIIQEEIENLVDDLVERTFVLQTEDRERVQKDDS